VNRTAIVLVQDSASHWTGPALGGHSQIRIVRKFVGSLATPFRQPAFGQRLQASRDSLDEPNLVLGAGRVAKPFGVPRPQFTTAIRLSATISFMASMDQLPRALRNGGRRERALEK
jgi:hypothetical protein